MVSAGGGFAPLKPPIAGSVVEMHHYPIFKLLNLGLLEFGTRLAGFAGEDNPNDFSVGPR